MEEKGVTPDDIQSVDDIKKLPFLSKADLRECCLEFPSHQCPIPKLEQVIHAWNSHSTLCLVKTFSFWPWVTTSGTATSD